MSKNKNDNIKRELKKQIHKVLLNPRVPDDLMEQLHEVLLNSRVPGEPKEKIDIEKDGEDLSGILEYLRELRKVGAIRHLLILSSVFIEARLRTLVERRMLKIDESIRKEELRSFLKKMTFSTLITFSYAMGCLDGIERDIINQLRNARNTAAHDLPFSKVDYNDLLNKCKVLLNKDEAPKSIHQSIDSLSPDEIIRLTTELLSLRIYLKDMPKWLDEG